MNKRIFDLVFEIEVLISMQKAFKGKINQEQINGLIKNCTEGFTNETVEKINVELKRKGVLTD